MTSHVLRHEQCPQCKAIGKDNERNNLAVYSDGHQWCFSCNYYVHGNTITRYTAKPIESKATLALPSDATPDIPKEAREWFCSYGFDDNTIKKHNLLWSERKEMLLFPYFLEGDLLGWQGRTFGADKTKRKWFTQGEVDTFIYTVGKRSNTLVLAESIVSAIKISRVQEASPIFGSHISNQRLLRISKLYDKIVIWLDPDKRKEAIKAAKTAQLFGLETHVVIADKKPKDYSIEEISIYVL